MILLAISVLIVFIVWLLVEPLLALYVIWIEGRVKPPRFLRLWAEFTLWGYLALLPLSIALTIQLMY